MFTSRGYSKRIDKIYERLLRLTLTDYESYIYDDMLSTLNEKTIYQRCISPLMTEEYKYVIGLYPEWISDIFYLGQNHRNFCSLNVFAGDNPCNKFLLNAIVYRANQL